MFNIVFVKDKNNQLNLLIQDSFKKKSIIVNYEDAKKLKRFLDNWDFK